MRRRAAIRDKSTGPEGPPTKPLWEGLQARCAPLRSPRRLSRRRPPPPRSPARA
ncbi:DUF6053 domain-containing protein [Lysobacter enzymogenes]|uniref:DUF6053 domain-containing protein n=1 Tax=Lysobacter enzymogenes TaxID=69 RepID=UPI003D18E55B